MIQLYTIGFKEKPAQEFFELLKIHNVKRLIDIRLNNTSQLAGFTKSRDLKYFLKEICKADYIHKPELAPTKELLNDYKNKELTWNDYEIVFNKILVDRNINEIVNIEEFDNACLLCSEHEPDQCHRRLVAEYLNKSFGNISIKHLV